jgi:hypothetical protein
MIWRRQGEEEEGVGGGCEPNFVCRAATFLFLSFAGSIPFASPTTVIANFSNYYKLCKTLDKIVINMALVFCIQSSVFLGVLNLFKKN